MVRNWRIFKSSVFFVLGFSIVFSIVGVLLQTILSNVSYSVQVWLGRLGGIVIITFGLFMLGLFNPAFLLREHKIKIKRRFSSDVNSFIFGAAFAVGWTPCVSAALGAVLALAAVQPSNAFLLLVAYTLGLGLPFLVVGFFADSAEEIIRKHTRFLQYAQYFFGVLLILLGIFVFVGQLSRVANFEFVVNTFSKLSTGINIGGEISSLTIINLAISFLAGLVSFLSPCVLPLLPAFLSYLSSMGLKDEE